MKKILKTKVKIRFQDCDPFNHLNNSKYIDYFLNARQDQLAEHYKIDIFENIETLGKSWIVTSNQINYIRPAHTLENVVIKTQLVQYTNTTVVAEMKMWNENETELKAIMWSKFTYYNLKSKRISNQSEELMEIYKVVLTPIKQSSFEERCTNIIKDLRAKKQ